MFTLFWTGDAHAPLLRIPTSSHAHGDTLFPSTSTVGIGTFLRRSHSGAYAYLARAIRHCEAVVGFEPMNEPHRGYINLFSFDTWDPYVDLLFGHVPSPLQSMALGDGRSMKVPFYDRSFPEPTSLKRYDLIRPPASGCWRDGCIWRRHGVWEWDEVKKRAIVMRRGYFERLPGRGETRIDYFRDCWWPFLREFGEAIQEVRKDWWLVAGAIPNEVRWSRSFPQRMRRRLDGMHRTRRCGRKRFSRRISCLRLTFMICICSSANTPATSASTCKACRGCACSLCWKERIVSAGCTGHVHPQRATSRSAGHQEQVRSSRPFSSL